MRAPPLQTKNPAVIFELKLFRFKYDNGFLLILFKDYITTLEGVDNL